MGFLRDRLKTLQRKNLSKQTEIVLSHHKGINSANIRSLKSKVLQSVWAINSEGKNPSALTHPQSHPSHQYVLSTMNMMPKEAS